MKCTKCNRTMAKIDRRDEIADLDEDASDGQMADYFAAELSGDNGAWNIGIVEYYCRNCDIYTQLIGDNLDSYCPLIRAWHEKAAEGDTFSRFVFQYLAFIAYVKNILYFYVSSERLAIQQLKREERIRDGYLDRVSQDKYLQKCWAEIIEELNREPLHNSSYDPDAPEIDKWWNSEDDQPSHEDDQPSGIIHSLDDWANMVEYWCSVRNNLFHGGESPENRRNAFLVEHAFITLRALVEIEIAT